MTNLTDLAIRKLPAPTKGRKIVWDKGLGVRISYTGNKTFVVKHDGAFQTLGQYPSMSLKMARRAQLEAKLAPTPKERLERTQDAISAFLEDCERRVRPSTRVGYEIRLKKLKSTHLSDITLRSIPNTPQHIAAVKAFLNWCIRMEYIDRNVFQFTKAKFGERDRVLTNAELRALWHYDSPPYSNYIKLLMLTGQRRGQFANQQYELREDSIYFPAEAMKAGVAHTLPLTDAIRDLLPVPYFNGWQTAKKRIDAALGLPHWVVHDLRRTFSTNCAAIGIPLHVTEEILAHRSGMRSGVARIYNRYHYQTEMREALDRFAAHLQAIVA